MASVRNIGKKRARRVFEDINPRFLGNVVERPITAVPEEAVRQSSGLTDVKIVVPIVVYITDRNSVVAVDVDPARAIKQLRQ